VRVSAWLGAAPTQYGGWFREPLDPASPEIITVARV
jgi:hypothetical protein